MAIWKRPKSKDEIETTDRTATIAYCESLGWKQKAEKKAPDPVAEHDAAESEASEAE